MADQTDVNSMVNLGDNGTAGTAKCIGASFPLEDLCPETDYPQLTYQRRKRLIDVAITVCDLLVEEKVDSQEYGFVDQLCHTLAGSRLFFGGAENDMSKYIDPQQGETITIKVNGGMTDKERLKILTEALIKFHRDNLDAPYFFHGQYPKKNSIFMKSRRKVERNTNKLNT